MKFVVLLAALVIGSGAALPAIAQTRVSGGARLPRPAPHGTSPDGAPLRPSRPQGRPPLGSTLIFSPKPAPAHGLLPIRLPWFGLVFYDPYWFEPGVGETVFPPAAAAVDGRPTGGLQLDVDPRRALVYVDGWFVGAVDRFSGYYQHLDLPAGAHQIELVASEYEPRLIDVVVSPGRTTTYRGTLNRARFGD